MAGIVAKVTVAVDLLEAGQQAPGVIQGVGTVGMARQLQAAPRGIPSRRTLGRGSLTIYFGFHRLSS